MEQFSRDRQGVLVSVRAEGFVAALSEFRTYLSDYRCLSPKTVAGYALDLTLFARFLRGRYRRVPNPEQVTRRDVIEWIASRGGAACSIRRRCSSLAAFWRWLLVTEQTERDPTAGIPRPRKPKRIPQALTELELATLLAVADKPWHRAAILLLCGTGLRSDELRTLEMADLDLEGGTLRVRHGKGDKERIVPLSSRVSEALRTYLPLRAAHKGVGALFVHSQGGPLRNLTLYNAVTYLAHRAGLDPKRITPHAFRRTFATRLVRRKVDIRTVQELLGHASLSTTAMYLEVDDRAQREAVEMAFQ